jgi:hypothetical protein
VCILRGVKYDSTVIADISSVFAVYKAHYWGVCVGRQPPAVTALSSVFVFSEGLRVGLVMTVFKLLARACQVFSSCLSCPVLSQVC